MVGTEALRVETDEANDGRLDSLRLREILERFLFVPTGQYAFQTSERGDR